MRIHYPAPPYISFTNPARFQHLSGTCILIVKMEESKQNQAVNNPFAIWRHEMPILTNQADDPAPALIDKKWLCHRLDLVHPSGRPKYLALYRYVLTPHVLQMLGLTEKEVRQRGFRIFSREQTVELVKILGL